MKKAIGIFMCLVIGLFFVGCESEKESLVFEDLEIEVKMQVGEDKRAVQGNTVILIEDAAKGYSLGVISVDKTKGKTIDEIYDTYIVGGGEKEKTELSDNLIFIDVLNEVDSVVLGERKDKMYCFIFYDKKTGAVLYGRFFENNERDDVINLAKTIEVIKI